MKNRILLDNYYLPGQLEQSIEEFVRYYNNCRYHESLEFDQPFGRARLNHRPLAGPAGMGPKGRLPTARGRLAFSTPNAA